MSDLTYQIYKIVKSILTFHYPDGSPNVFIFSTPRSGSTWLMELIKTQPGFKCCNEPFQLRNDYVKNDLGITKWHDLYNYRSTERIRRYITSIVRGRICRDSIRYYNPFSKDYDLITRRIVFKILHTGEDRIEWFKNNFNGRIVFLLRHPIPVSLSRKVLPRLNAFIESEYSRYFTKEQLQYADKIVAEGSKLERSVLSWCLQNMVPIKNIKNDWLFITYEQLVIDPNPIIDRLTTELLLPFPEKIKARLNVPSKTTSLSDHETKRYLAKSLQDDILKKSDKKWLIEKWRKQISPKEEENLMGIPKMFGIDYYSAGTLLPKETAWIT